MRTGMYIDVHEDLSEIFNDEMNKKDIKNSP